MTNLITTIKTASETLNHIFMYGDGRYFEKNINEAKLSEGQNGLMLNIESFNPIIENRMYNGEVEYQIQLFMFRKTEAKTQSSLSETAQQKFDYRMGEIQKDLMYLVTSLTQCTNDIDLLNPNYTPGMNITSAGVDGWFLSCKLKLFNQWATNS